MMTSPWSPTVNGCTECARREERSVGMPSLSKRLFTTTASARSQRRTSARPPSARGSRGSIGNRITFPRRVIGPSIIPLLATQPAGGTDGKVRVLRRNSRDRNRSPGAPRGSPRPPRLRAGARAGRLRGDRKSTRLNSSHSQISYAVFCLKKKKKKHDTNIIQKDLKLAKV